jgi:hypothetical protein
MIPSDSINHHNLKLAEFLTGLQNQPAMAAPPPPYDAARPLGSISSEETLGLVSEAEDYGDSIAPIVINIDTSIHVDGEDNTVIIPSSMSSGQEDAPASATAETSPTPPCTPTTTQQRPQQRQTKSAQLATSIIAGLKFSGALEDPESGRLRPIEINVNAGVHVRGNRNVVCAGTRKPPQPAHLSQQKRRAESVRFIPAVPFLFQGTNILTFIRRSLRKTISPKDSPTKRNFEASFSSHSTAKSIETSR